MISEQYDFSEYVTANWVQPSELNAPNAEQGGFLFDHTVQKHIPPLATMEELRPDWPTPEVPEGILIAEGIIPEYTPHKWETAAGDFHVKSYLPESLTRCVPEGTPDPCSAALRYKRGGFSVLKEQLPEWVLPSTFVVRPVPRQYLAIQPFVDGAVRADDLFNNLRRYEPPENPDILNQNLTTLLRQMTLLAFNKEIYIRHPSILFTPKGEVAIDDLTLVTNNPGDFISFKTYRAAVIDYFRLPEEQILYPN